VKEEFDSEEIYCRKLGHHLGFSYCRRERGGLPCPRILECWARRLPVREFLKSNYSPEELAPIGRPAPGKASTLISLIEAARKSAECGEKTPGSGG